MEQNWVRLGAAMKAARKARGLTQPALGQLVGVSRATVQNIEAGQALTKITPTLRAIERELGWREGSIETVLAGGDPQLAQQSIEDNAVPAAVAGEASARETDLPLRIVEELAEGRLLDTTVLDLSPSGSGARMIVVVRGEPDASPEQIRADLLAWRKTQRRLQELEGDGDGDDEPPVANGA